jgi:glutamate/tyrosine decarboxylase-like PLP-dependent enzyme
LSPGEGEVLRRAAEHAIAFRHSLPERPVAPTMSAAALRAALGGPLPEEPTESLQVIDDLVAATADGLVAMAGPRYFGFVIGGSLPAAVGADWLAAAWDQNAGLFAAGPAACIVEEVAGAWLLDVLGLPATASFAFVTGCQMAHVTALAAARHAVLTRAGWDVNDDGLAGAPPIEVVVGAERHVTVDRALRLLGIGKRSVTPVEVDGQGRMDVAALQRVLRDRAGVPTIVCAQAGNIDTGAVDPIGDVVDIGHRHGAWVHIDGAFGLWAAASRSRASLLAGHDGADSWATDCHKWLNVPYDSGFAAVADPSPHRMAMSVRAPYLKHADGDDPPRDQVDWTPEFSRRARGFAVYAALRQLGRTGIAELVDRCCEHATRFAERLDGRAGARVLNDVVLNQVLVSFGDARRTQAVIDAVQADGTCWLGGTTWQNQAAMRISVSGATTTTADVDRSCDVILAAAADMAESAV